MTIKEHNLRECPAMRALESLTAQGSEFVDDIPRCVAYVKAARESQHKAVVKFKTERDALARSHEALVQALQHILDAEMDRQAPTIYETFVTTMAKNALAEAEKVSQ